VYDAQLKSARYWLDRHDLQFYLIHSRAHTVKWMKQQPIETTGELDAVIYLLRCPWGVSKKGKLTVISDQMMARQPS